jgi:carboxyl-terminal processing protease
VPKRNLAWILVVAMIALLMWQMPQTIAGRDAVYKAFGPLVDVRTQIERRYVEEIDDEKLVNAAVRSGVNGMVEVLNDPHAAYLNDREYDRFKKRTDGIFGGVGVDVWPVEGGLEVLSREPNSPASQAGILPGDIITHVDGRLTSRYSLVDAVNNLLNGIPDTEVVLTVVRPKEDPGTPKEITLRRAMIHLDPIRGWSRSPSGAWRFMLDEENHIAYVRLTKFTNDVDEKLDERMNRLLREDLRGLVLDLRDNTGGLLSSAIEVADRFLEGGLLIVSTRGRASDEKRWYATEAIGYPQFYMAVLINGSTASAAEIVAGSLRDHQRAAVVGERSYGKGSVQEVVELERHSGALKLTTAYYYLPCGQCIQKTAKTAQEGTWGVTPTIPVNLTERQLERLQDTRRLIARETVVDAASQPATAPASTADDAGRQTDADSLLKTDLQLREALQYVQRQIAKTPGKGRGESSSAPAAGSAP